MENKELVIAISGKMLTGKNTILEILSEYLEEDGYISKQISCAGGLKKDVCNYLQIDLSNAYTQEGKSKTFTSPAGRTATLRQFLQSHGENMKQTFGNKYWINLAVEDGREVANSGNIPICDDARFPFELSGFRDNFKNSYFILVVRSEENRGINPSDPIHQHESETEIPDSLNPIWDCVINNNDSIEALRRSVSDAYNEIKFRYLV